MLVRILHHILCLVVLVQAASCVRLPQNTAQESFHITDTGDTRLAKTFTAATAAHPGRSGLHPMSSGVDAFVARLTLADLAEKSLDVQYYIWDPDNTGRLLAERMVAAADRGVRVRMLLDDQGSAAEDSALLTLDSHPNIEVRLFNPMAIRGESIFGLLVEFERTTRRMHNKSFNADNQAVIVGGRNIGDEYFQASSGHDMADLDVLAVGAVVEEAGQSFDTYWNSRGSFPITSLSKHTRTEKEVDAGRRKLQAHAERMKGTTIGAAFAGSPIVRQIENGSVPFYWGNARLLYDDPQKAAGQSDDPEHRMLPRIRSIVDDVDHEVMLVSPYFIPGKAGIEYFRKLRQRGIRIVILTASLASTDVLPVYAAYTRYRKELLAMGVELYEFKPGAPGLRNFTGSDDDDDNEESVSAASLHAKVFSFDRTSMFVGSLNLDPRSARLNTEVGVVFDSREMAQTLSDEFEARLPTMAWRVETAPVKGLFGKGVRLNWVTQEHGSTVRLTKEPGQSFWRNLSVGFLRAIPIESQL